MSGTRSIVLLVAILGIAGCANLFGDRADDRRAHDDQQLATQAYLAGDFPTALGLWGPLAEGGNPAAQFGIGVLYEEGNGVPRDYDLAGRWYWSAADQGYAAAQFNYGKLYHDGLGVDVDTLRAAQWYVLAARQGDAKAQYNLAFLYVNDPAVTCAAVVPRDCTALLGEQPDAALGAIWYRLAAEQGMAEAQNNLGAMYGAGLGVPFDAAEAYAWFSISSDQGNAAAQENRDVAAAAMTFEDIAAGQTLARQYWELYVVPFRN
jgi:TPR repeat protein